MMSNGLNAAVYLTANISIHLAFGWLLLETNPALGKLIITLYAIKKISQAIYTYNEIKERSEQITNLFKSMNQELDVDNVVEFKKDKQGDKNEN